ncbi:MAG: HD domain-containing phosphohydrolase, partial [Planctomycetota bacterium]
VGADDYLCKPLNPAEVKQRIRQLLGRGAAPAPAEPEPSSAPEPPAPGPTEPAAPEARLTAEHLARAEAVYDDCRRFAEDAAERAKSEEPPDIDRCRDLAARLVRECQQSNRLLIKAIRSYQTDESSHDAVNCAIFSVKIGAGLNYDTEELTALAMAALCHEVGMSCVPEEVAAAEGKYSRRQRSAIRRHPEHAYRILKKLGPEYEWLAEAVYQEHEREGGQGYPQGLAGDEISEFAKVIGLADTYESLSHRRPFRRAFIAFDALREVIGMRHRYFAPHIIRALVAEVSVFPLESYVQLNTGEIARVVRTSPDNLLRPVVVVEYDSRGNRLKRARVVDLASRPLIYVTEAVDERELVTQG